MPNLSLESIQSENPEVFPDILKHMSQQNCSRCGGMMVRETCMDLFSDYGQFQFQVKHCIQCGETIDPLILLNRLKMKNFVCPSIDFVKPLSVRHTASNQLAGA